MGNLLPHEPILEQSIEDTVGRLYWPTPPFEGPIKLRFFCSECSEESIVLSPFPTLWKELINLKGECFICKKLNTIHTKFIEAGKKRETIWAFKGKDIFILGPQLTKFIRAGPPAHEQLEGMLVPELMYTRAVHPPNFRDTTLLGADFQYRSEIYSLPLNKKQEIFIKTAKRIKTWDRWKLVVKRSDNLLAQACKAFLEAPPSKIRGSFKIKFEGEEAYDFGGVSREFFQIVSKQMLDPSNNLFLPNGPNNTFHPSPTSAVNETHLNYFHFFGRFLAKALLEQRLVNAPFTRAIWKLLLGKGLTFVDFQTVDKQTYTRLRETLDYDEETLASCSFVFAANIEDFGAGKMYPLKEGGCDEEVTGKNIHEWIVRYSAWKMVDCVYEQLHALLTGFYDIIPVQLLSLFNEMELEQILCGISEINVEDWKQYSVMIGLKGRDDQYDWFWSIVELFSNEQRALLMQFTTGSAQVPLSFEFYNPPFTISFNTPGLAVNSLPYSHTCFNRLDLPRYTTSESMHDAVAKALELGVVGFGLK